MSYHICENCVHSTSTLKKWYYKCSIFFMLWATGFWSESNLISFYRIFKTLHKNATSIDKHDFKHASGIVLTCMALYLLSRFCWISFWMFSIPCRGDQMQHFPEWSNLGQPLIRTSLWTPLKSVALVSNLYCIYKYFIFHMFKLIPKLIFIYLSIYSLLFYSYYWLIVLFA